MPRATTEPVGSAVLAVGTLGLRPLRPVMAGSGRSLAVALLVLVGQSAAAVAQPVQSAPGQSGAVQVLPEGPRPPVANRGGQTFSIEAGTGRVIAIPRAAATVFAADPRVAEVRPASPTSLFVFGVAPGTTTVAALDAAGLPVAQIEVTVRPSTYTASEVAGAARALAPRGIQVVPRANGVALYGEVATAADANQAVAIARSFLAPGQVVDNRLTVLGAVQVNLRVRVAEMSRDIARQLGINWDVLARSGRFAFTLLTNTSLADLANLPNRFGASYTSTSFSAEALIDALAQDRLVTILAEPNLTAMSGETASFLAGGEFPVPVSQRDNQVTVEFKQYGISLAFVPTVSSDQRITLRVRPEVSELTDVGAVRLVTAGGLSLQIPALSVRRAETTVELGSGQSFAIAGLLSDSSRSIGRAIPGIGEIPILGALFRSERFQRSETELVIIVTPFIVRPVDSVAALRTPTDGFVPPTSDIDRVLFFRQRARQAGSALPPLPGAVGFTMN